VSRVLRLTRHTVGLLISETESSLAITCTGTDSNKKPAATTYRTGHQLRTSRFIIALLLTIWLSWV